MHLNPISPGIEYLPLYRIIPILLILFTVTGFRFFVKTLTQKVFSVMDYWIISLLFTLLFISVMPRVATGFYWYTGSATYQLGSILVLYYLGLLIRYLRKHYLITKRIHLIINILLLGVIIGFNEIIMIYLLLFLLTIWLVLARKEKKLKFEGLFVQVVFASLFAAIMFFAPGNEVRGGQFEDRHLLFNSFYMSGLQTVRFGLLWVFSGSLLLISILFINLLPKLNKEIALFRNRFYLNQWEALGILIFIVFMSVFPAYWSTGILGQHRTVNVGCFFFLIFWFITLSIWWNKHDLKIKLTKIAATALLIFTGAIFTFTGNGYHAMFDAMTGRAAYFDDQMNHRIFLIQQAKKESNEPIDIGFMFTHNLPKTIFVLDIDTKDETHWINKGYVQYFELPEGSIVRYDSK